MKKVILLSATHWDREWYFAEETSSILLQRLFSDLNNLDFKFTLDGQASLLDNYLITEELTDKQQKSIQKGLLQIGPLYAQSDVLNSSFGTTQYNILYGKEVIKNHNAFLPKTIFMPDSFGFNEQLPQIFLHHGFSNFAFWRGLKVNDQDKSNIFTLRGIDGSEVNALATTKCYNCIMDFMPWDNHEIDDEKKFITFKKAIYDYLEILQTYSEQEVYLIPLSGDQVPFPKLLKTFVEKLNAKNEYLFELGHLDDFFNAHKNTSKPLIDYFLYYSGSSKIHRTIHSNRYDIKQAFRQVEHNLYYKMEQVELMYQSVGGQPLSKKYKDIRIYKPLLETSAHDSLGCCNSDATNSAILQRLKNINETILSYINLMLHDIKTAISLKKDEYVIFNFAPFQQDLLFEDIISNRSTTPINHISEKTEMLEITSKDLSFKEHEAVVNHRVFVKAKDMEPFSYRVIQLEHLQQASVKKDFIKFENDTIKIICNEKQVEFKILIEENFGDEFDFSSNSQGQKKFINNFEIVNYKIGKSLKTFNVVAKCNFRNVDYQISLEITSDNENINVLLATCNNLQNARVSLVFNQKLDKLSRHLAFVKQTLDEIPNWKISGYKDMPINNFPQDGLVILENGLNIFTAGTNEVEANVDSTKLILYRTSEMVGKPNLDYRPGAASGLTYKIHTPDAQLQKELQFVIRMNFCNPIASLNSWLFKGIGVQAEATNVMPKKIDRFIKNISALKMQMPSFIPVDHCKFLIGLYNFDENKNLRFVLSNPLEKANDDFKGYEIKFFGKW